MTTVLYIHGVRHDSDATVRAEVFSAAIRDAGRECHVFEPTLSSILPDFERSGEFAVRLLARRLSDPASPHRTESYGIKSVVRRQSTHILRTDDPCVARGGDRSSQK